MKRPTEKELKDSIDKAMKPQERKTAFMLRPVDFNETEIKIEFMLAGRGKQTKWIPRVKED